MNINENENNVFSVEELYDMDLNKLNEVKQNIENGFYDNDDDENMTRDEMLSFVNAEIKERNAMNDVVDFFLTTDIDMFKLDPFEQKLEKENKTFTSFSKDSNTLSTIHTKNDLSFNKKSDLFSKTDFKVKDTNLFFDKVKPKKETTIGELLSRTRVGGENFQFVVGSSVQQNTWKPFSDKSKRKSVPPLRRNLDDKWKGAHEDKKDTNKIKGKIIIEVPVVRKKIKKKSHKVRKHKVIEDDPGLRAYELRKNYVVPDVKSFIKKKEQNPDAKKEEKGKDNHTENKNNSEKKVEKNNYKETPTQTGNFEEKIKVNNLIETTIKENNVENPDIQNNEKKDVLKIPSQEISEEKKEDVPIRNGSLTAQPEVNNEINEGDLRKEMPLDIIHQSLSYLPENKTETSQEIKPEKDPNQHSLLKFSYNNEVPHHFSRQEPEEIKESSSENEDENSSKNPDRDSKSNSKKTKKAEDNSDSSFTEEERIEVKKEKKSFLARHEPIKKNNFFEETAKTTDPAIAVNEEEDNVYRLNKKTSKTIQHDTEKSEELNEEDEFEDEYEELQQTKKNLTSQQVLHKDKNSNHLNTKPFQDKSVNKREKRTANYRPSFQSHTQNQFHSSKKPLEPILLSNHNQKDPAIPVKLNPKTPSRLKDSLQTSLGSHFSAATKPRVQTAFKRQIAPLNQSQTKFRPQSGQIPSLSSRLILSNALPIQDYSKIYKNFYEIFNGYFLSATYSNAKNFNFESTITTLYESFKQLHRYEQNSVLLQEKDMMYSDIVKAEAGMIKNRLKKVSEKLLNDEDGNPEKYYLLKKVLELEKKNYAERTASDPNTQTKMFFRVVLSRPEIYDIVCYTLGIKEQWSELPHGLSLGTCWNLLWTYAPPNIDFTKIFSFQKVNHLINNRTIHRKDMLKKHISRIRNMNKKLYKSFDIMPQTFLLAKEYMGFIEEFHRLKKIDPLNLWIVKPIGKSRGKGIYLIDDIGEVPLADTFLVQKYLTNPLLLDGYKFDLRCYCLVTSVNPLEMFIYKDGFARMSNEKFDLTSKNNRIHLTNAAIQNGISKKSSNFEKVYGGSKISLDILKYKLNKKGIDFSKIWSQIKSIILKAMIACQNDIPYSPSTFELFGFDIIIDDTLKCWLLEINSSPSLERSNVLDDQIKLKLVDDVFNIIDPINIDREALIKVLERVLKIKTNKEIYLYSPAVQLNIDLTIIFQGKVPRAYGEMPEKMGQFERLAPTQESERLIKITGGQKMFGGKRDKK